MATPSPKIDQRTAADIERQVVQLIQQYSDAQGAPLPIVPHEGVGAALIAIFSHFSEIVIERLNQAPEKNFLAFLDMLGVSLAPLQPARAPLTFFLAAGSTADAVVPAGTQVAATLAEGETEPAVFETEREFVVTAAQLTSLYVRDPARDQFAQLSAIANTAVADGQPMFRGNRHIEHILYFSHRDLLGLPHIASLRATFRLGRPLGDSGQLAWQRWDGAEWVRLIPRDSGAARLSGQVNTLEFGSSGPIPIRAVNKRENRWLRCVLQSPITSEDQP